GSPSRTPERARDAG
ncbi:MAG: hypothetical protein GY911_09105, partial [Actinomycetales bacterium]|nr:hypothetical protein [Actinomycetales bacterium]